MHAQSPVKASTATRTMMGVLAFVCCLMCAHGFVQANSLPPPLHMGEVPTKAQRTAEQNAPEAFTPHTAYLLRPSLGQGQVGTTPESHSPRKKKKRLLTQDNKHLAFLAWLAAFCIPPSPVQKTQFPLIEREDKPCLPSFRGFVFFPLPPPLFS